MAPALPFRCSSCGSGMFVRRLCEKCGGTAVKLKPHAERIPEIAHVLARIRYHEAELAKLRPRLASLEDEPPAQRKRSTSARGTRRIDLL